MKKTGPLFIQEQEIPWEQWEDEATNEVSPILWKTLITSDRLASTNITLGITAIPVGAVELKHSHPAPEAYYFLEGLGIVHIDGAAYPVKSGSALFIPGNAEHMVTNTGEETLRFVYVFPLDRWRESAYTFSEERSDH